MGYFANTLRDILAEQDLTQVELSKEAGVSQAQISRYLRSEDRPLPALLERLCKALPDSGLRLWLAYFKDTVPASLRRLIEIRSVETDETLYRENPGVLDEVPNSVRAFLERAARACEQRPKLLKAFETMLETVESKS